MKKVALCLSGHARTYLHTHRFWNTNLFSRFETDVFMHLWDTIGPRSFGEGMSEHYPSPRNDYDSGIVSSPELNVTEIISMWKPVSITVEKYDTLHPFFVNMTVPIINERDRRGIPGGFEHHHPLSVRSMLYKRYKCNELKKSYEKINNIKYDIVIQTRPDVVLTQQLDNIFADNSSLHFHNCRSTTPDPEINDYGAVGTSQQVDTWCDLYEYVDELFESIKTEENFFKFLNPHKMYAQYLIKKNQPYKESDIHLSILRDSGIILGWDHDKQVIRDILSNTL